MEGRALEVIMRSVRAFEVEGFKQRNEVPSHRGAKGALSSSPFIVIRGLASGHRAEAGSCVVVTAGQNAPGIRVGVTPLHIGVLNSRQEGNELRVKSGRVFLEVVVSLALTGASRDLAHGGSAPRVLPQGVVSTHMRQKVGALIQGVGNTTPVAAP